MYIKFFSSLFLLTILLTACDIEPFYAVDQDYNLTIRVEPFTVSSAGNVDILWLGEEKGGTIKGLILSISPSIPIAQVGELIYIDSTDPKILDIQPGDRVSFTCNLTNAEHCTIYVQEDKKVCKNFLQFSNCRIRD